MDTPQIFTLDYDRLALQVRRTSSLPSLPTMAAELIQAIDSGRAGTTKIESILSADPGLAANLLRTTNLEGDGKGGGISSIRWAIMKARTPAIRKLATFVFSESVGKGGAESRVFDRLRLARHSYFVANFSARLIQWKQARLPFRSQWSSDEVYISALLHDFVFSLFARVAPAEFRLLEDHSRHYEKRLSEGFKELSGHSMVELELEVATSWKLPSVFAEINSHLERPLEHETESMTLACLAFSHIISEQVGLGLEDWVTNSQIPDEIEAWIDIPQNKLRELAKASLTDIATALPPDRRAFQVSDQDEQSEAA